MNGFLQFDVDVVAHLMARDAELLGIGRFQRRVETAPEDHPGNEPPKCQKAQAVMDAGSTQNGPIVFEQDKQ
ncbi:hypothetical protein D3C79_1095370 [compost metagenome]